MTLYGESGDNKIETKTISHGHKDENQKPEVDLEVKQSGKSVRVQTDKPHLVSLGGGRLSTGITIHPLPEGTTYIGRIDAGRSQDIIIQGPGAEREHCVIENTEGIVILYPLCGSVTVDGVKADSPVRLTQGCMLCFGRSNHFRFNHPQQARQIKKILPNGDISVVQLRDIREIQELGEKAPSEANKKSSKKSGEIVYGSSYADRDREVWDSVDFVDKVSKFEYLSHKNASDDRSSHDSGCSDVSWPASPARTSVSSPEHSPGCIILQQSHFNSSPNSAFTSSSLNRAAEIEREKRRFLSDLYGKPRTLPHESGCPLYQDSDNNSQEMNRKPIISSNQENSNFQSKSSSLSHLQSIEGPHYRANCAQSPPHQKRIKTNGSLPRCNIVPNSEGVEEVKVPLLQSAVSPPPVARRQDSVHVFPDTQESALKFDRLKEENEGDYKEGVENDDDEQKTTSSLQNKIEELVDIRAECWQAISEYQRSMEELIVQENETLHELNMEHALISGEQSDEQGSQEKDIEELEDLYRRKRLFEEIVTGKEEIQEGEKCLKNADVSEIETEINSLKCSIEERKERLKDLMKQQDVLVQQLKEERVRLQKQKDQLTDSLQQEFFKLKRTEEELEKLTLLSEFELGLEDLKDVDITQGDGKTENGEGLLERRVRLGELGKELEQDETSYRTSDIWTGSDGAYDVSSAITTDSDVTDSTEGRQRRESLVIANQDETCGDYLDKYHNGSIQDKRSRQHAQRPLTRYLPVRGGDIDLRRHIESAGHQIVLCPHVDLTSSSCRGYLHVLTGRWRGWKKRWVVFDRRQKTLVFYSDRTENKLKDGITFQCIEEVYVDHEHSSRSPNPRSTFCVKTDDQLYYLTAPNAESMRIWVDVIFTGAEGYRHFIPGFDP